MARRLSDERIPLVVRAGCQYRCGDVCPACCLGMAFLSAIYYKSFSRYSSTLLRNNAPTIDATSINTAMRSTPKEWQEKMAELLHEYDETINTGAFGVHSCFVTVKDENNKFMKMPEELVNYRHPSQETVSTLLRKN
jgi:hypothetical protein